jgi:hypothetical protein
VLHTVVHLHSGFVNVSHGNASVRVPHTRICTLRRVTAECISVAKIVPFLLFDVLLLREETCRGDFAGDIRVF